MKILHMDRIEGWLVSTDEAEYRCNRDGTSWERLYGESWESEYFDEAELTELFQRKMKGQ